MLYADPATIVSFGPNRMHLRFAINLCVRLSAIFITFPFSTVSVPDFPGDLMKFQRDRGIDIRLRKWILRCWALGPESAYGKTWTAKLLVAHSSITTVLFRQCSHGTELAHISFNFSSRLILLYEKHFTIIGHHRFHITYPQFMIYCSFLRNIIG